MPIRYLSEEPIEVPAEDARLDRIVDAEPVEGGRLLVVDVLHPPARKE